MSNKNQKAFCFVFMVLCCAGFFGFENVCLADDGLIISEILVGGEKADEEFIEIHNPTFKDINLETLPLKLHTINSSEIATDTDKSLTFEKSVVPANGYFVISSKEYKEKFGNIADAFYGSGVLAKGWSVYISKSHEKLTGVLDIIKWEECEKNYSYSFNGTNWKCTSLLTPGKENKFNKIPEPKIYSDKIIINELLPKPDSANTLYKEEFVELYNSSDKPENLDGWFLKDRAGKICDLSGETIETGGFLAVKNAPDKKCALALNDTQGEVLGLYDPKNVLVSNVSYDSSAKKGKSYSFDGESWRWSQYLTPEEDNLFNNLPVILAKKENKIYVDTYAQFSTKGSDKDGEKLKFTWDFGDGHKSYLQNTRHKYAKTGNYTATLKVSDGNEDVLETFKIKVIKFPKIKISIKELSANPNGLDSEKEYIVIKNESGKKINLKNWSIATGSKNLYNHPVTRDFILKPGQSKKITGKYSKFALANQKCKIEIRYPNGKVAYKLKYAKNKIIDDEIYKKVNGKWAWITPLAENKLALVENPAENIPVIAIEYKNMEIQKNLGKYSKSPARESKIILTNYGTSLSLPDSLGSQPRVLGASTMRANSPYFFFGRPYAPEPHWAVKFINTLRIKINQLLNKFIIYSHLT